MVRIAKRCSSVSRFESKELWYTYMYSLRSGGVKAAANFGVPDKLFKKHGRWRLEIAIGRIHQKLYEGSSFGFCEFGSLNNRILMERF